MTGGSGMRVRLAPPLAGYLTLSSARVALLTWLWARKLGGEVRLRLDDIDPRDAAHAVDAEGDLRWLGLDWDATERQSGRGTRYAEAAAALERSGRLYACFESEDELRAKRDLRARRNQATIYDRAMLKMTAAQRAAAEARGKRPYFRFLLSPEPVGWNDAVLGRTRTKLSAMSDPVVIRADGTPLPLFAAVLDDLDAGITHILASDEMRGASAIALDMFSALGGDVTRLRLAHVAPLAGEADRLTLRRLRTDGIEPAAIAACLAADTEAPTLAELRAGFDVTKADAGAAFDMGRLRAVNRAVLSRMAFAEVAPRLPPGATEAFWLAVRAHLDLLTEARGWWDVVAGTIVPPVIEGEGDFLRTALDKLPAEPWNGGVWAAWTAALAEATGRAGAAITDPLRLALTGEDHGPDLAALLPLIGWARAAPRLRVAAA
jgi:glutamyl-tRNA synthetase